MAVAFGARRFAVVLWTAAFAGRLCLSRGAIGPGVVTFVALAGLWPPVSTSCRSAFVDALIFAVFAWLLVHLWTLTSFASSVRWALALWTRFAWWSRPLDMCGSWLLS